MGVGNGAKVDTKSLGFRQETVALRDHRDDLKLCEVLLVEGGGRGSVLLAGTCRVLYLRSVTHVVVVKEAFFHATTRAP